MPTLPTFTRTIDNAFTTTWYKIQSEARDNIMLSTHIWEFFVRKGRLKNQNGSEIITRTIDYALIDAIAFARGVVFTSSTPESRTMAQWTWRFLGTNLTRSMMEDRANAGQFKIIDYVQDKMMKARKGLKTKFERQVLGTHVSDESGIEWQTLNDIVPPAADRTNGFYGGIARPTAYAAESSTSAVLVPSAGNTFWGAKYLAGTGAPEINLEADLTSLYNSVQNNQVDPDLIITDKYLFEIYDQYSVDKTQIVRQADGSAGAGVDLGIKSFYFKGAEWTWTPNAVAKSALVLTSENIDVVYDSNMWFDMTTWKPVPNSLDSFAQIVCAGNIVSDEPRRHGRLTYA